MKKMNFTSQILRISSLLLVFLTMGVSLNAQLCLDVIEKVKLPINTPLGDPACKRVLTAADVFVGGIVPAGATISIRKGPELNIRTGILLMLLQLLLPLAKPTSIMSSRLW